MKAGAIRLLMFQTHYRQRLDLTDEALVGAQRGSERLGEFARRLGGGGGGSGGSDESQELVSAAERLAAAFTEAMNEDLNAPKAVAAVFDFVAEGNRLLDEKKVPGPKTREVWRLVDSVLDAATERRVVTASGAAGAKAGDVADAKVVPGGAVGGEDWAQDQSAKRQAAKKKRDFAEADRIRDLLKEHGFEIRDTPSGPEIVRK